MKYAEVFNNTSSLKEGILTDGEHAIGVRTFKLLQRSIPLQDCEHGDKVIRYKACFPHRGLEMSVFVRTQKLGDALVLSSLYKSRGEEMWGSTEPGSGRGLKGEGRDGLLIPERSANEIASSSTATTISAPAVSVPMKKKEINSLTILGFNKTARGLQNTQRQQFVYILAAKSHIMKRLEIRNLSFTIRLKIQDILKVKDVIGTPADELLEPVHLGKVGVLCVLQSRTRSMWLDVLSVSHLSVENTNKLFAQDANKMIVIWNCEKHPQTCF
uniref:Uncharacterized protein n=1 Tax=Timema monikensis TaxID=170555 RepID=A0A7R9EHC7_9NEOP|nr:unnamed protein product [Timema monikensis]